MEEIIIGVLAGVLGKTADSISKELKDAEGNFKPHADFKAKLEEAIKSKISAAEKAGREGGLGRAKKEVLEEAEAKIAAKHGIEEYDSLDDLVSKIATSKTGDSALDPTKIRESQTYKDDLKKLHDKIQKVTTEAETYKAETSTREIKGAVRKLAIALIEKEKYALPKTESVREAQIENYVNALMGKADFVKSESGSLIPFKKGTKEHFQDDFLVNQTFEGFGVSVASGLFEVMPDQPGETIGGETIPGGGAAGGGKGKHGLTSHEDYFTGIRDPKKTPEEKKELNAEYKAAIASGIIK